jgi:hypothetical protein
MFSCKFSFLPFNATNLFSQSTASPTSNSLIPSGISQGCSTFLQNFDADTATFSCLTSLLPALSAYGPGGSTPPPNATAIAASLDSFCALPSCPDTVFRSNLAAFQSACSNELMTSGSNQNVIQIYDALYTLIPLQDVVCLKDENGKYCVLESTTAAAPGNTTSDIVDRSDHETTNIQRRDNSTSNSTQAYSPNEETWTMNNIAFLLLQPSESTQVLCSSCTRQILGTYITFESDAPYAPGLAQSTLLSNQPALYNAVESQCGSAFLGGAVQAAGGLSNGGPLGGSSSSSALSISGGLLSTVVVISASVVVGSFAML